MLNKVILIGRIGREPKTANLDNETKAFCGFSLATDENYKDKGGEWQQKTEWHNIKAFRKLAQRMSKLTKGSLIYLEGKIQTNEWVDEQSNEKKYSKEIIVNMFKNLTPNNTSNSTPSASSQGFKTKDDGDDLPF